jgi:hypothetical protein
LPALVASLQQQGKRQQQQSVSVVSFAKAADNQKVIASIDASLQQN